MKKGTFSTVIWILVFVTGLSLLLYPTVSDLWNSMHQARTITEYTGKVETLDKATYEKLLADARAYNRTLPDRGTGRFQMEAAEREAYNNLLNVSGNGVMGYLEVPVLGAAMPIYHSADETVLQTAIGHVEGSSLPVGGPGTHSVLSGHRGLPRARLFTDLDRVREGDIFTIKVLGETLAYRVDQIQAVLPHEMRRLPSRKGRTTALWSPARPMALTRTAYSSGEAGLKRRLWRRSPKRRAARVYPLSGWTPFPWWLRPCPSSCSLPCWPMAAGEDRRIFLCQT